MPAAKTKDSCLPSPLSLAPVFCYDSVTVTAGPAKAKTSVLHSKGKTLQVETTFDTWRERIKYLERAPAGLSEDQGNCERNNVMVLLLWLPKLSDKLWR